MISTKQLAAEAGVNLQRVSQWAKEGLADHAKFGHNKWDRERALAWIEARRAGNRHDPIPQNDDGTITVAAGDITAERCGLYRAQREGAELRNDMLRGELSTRRRVLEIWTALTGELITVVDSWVREGGTAHQIAENQRLANELRRRVKDSHESLARDIDAGEDVGPTRVRLPRRMGG